MRAVAATGALLMLMSSFLVWIEAPLGEVQGGLSFNWMALLIGCVSSVAWLLRSGRLLSISGVCGLGLWSFSIPHLTFMDSAFWSLVDQNAQYANILSFSSRFLPANLGVEPGFEAALLTETVLDRLSVASYFMGWGWWICMAGSLLLLAGGFKIGGRQAIRWTVVSAILLFSGQGVMLLNGLAAQYLQEMGDRRMAVGDYAEAVRSYERVQQLDPQLERNEQVHLHLGEAYDHLGMSSHPDTRFYMGDRHAGQRHFEDALSEYMLVEMDRNASPALKGIVRRRIAWTHIHMGLAQYRKGNTGQATGEWEKALAFDPTQVQAAYFLTRVYFDQGRYEQSIAIGSYLLSRSTNRLLKANVQANIGDGYWKLNDFKNARIAYESSMDLDSYANFRIFKNLGGT